MQNIKFLNCIKKIFFSIIHSYYLNSRTNERNILFNHTKNVFSLWTKNSTRNINQRSFFLYIPYFMVYGRTDPRINLGYNGRASRRTDAHACMHSDANRTSFSCGAKPPHTNYCPPMGCWGWRWSWSTFQFAPWRLGSVKSLSVICEDTFRRGWQFGSGFGYL